jgi:hypothetical protein
MFTFGSGDHNTEHRPLAAAGKAAGTLPPANFLAISGGGDAAEETSGARLALRAAP